jgi:ADP-dependent NAD(P)H-hydrate dehydratase / NAD(P)H-hydrate epimerase
MKSISVAQARAIDRDAVERLGMPSILLMENAARSVAEVARQMGDAFLVYCGPGNNGGDGLAAARHLGRRARVFLTQEPDETRSPDAALQLTILRRAGYPVSVGALPPLADPGDVLIDALFGTGLTRPLTGDAARFVARFNESPGHKLCVDIPSGLHGDDGVPLGPTCRGDQTITFAAAKHGLLTDSAAPHVGELLVVGLGLPA